MDFFLLAQSSPGGGSVVDLLSRVFHTTCAATLLGGIVYLRFVLAPAMASGDDAETVCYAGRRRAWSLCVGICTGLLLLSGFYNFLNIIGANEKLPSLYHAVFGIKFLLALVVFGVVALLAGKTPLAAKLQSRMKLWLNVALVSALGVFVCGAVLRSVPKVPKLESEAPRYELPSGIEGPAAIEGPMLQPPEMPEPPES